MIQFSLHSRSVEITIAIYVSFSEKSVEITTIRFLQALKSPTHAFLKGEAES